MILNEPKLTPELIQKYDLRVPRYTSYPTVPNWKGEYTHLDHIRELENIGEKSEPISLYLHIPFCIRRCLFCACNVIVTNQHKKSQAYLETMIKEIKFAADKLGERDKIAQFHLGGGTPTHFTPEQLDQLFSVVYDTFKLDPRDSEKSIELHPSVTTNEHLDVLGDYNFNRLSIGVQDFDPLVQEKLNRHQTFEETRDLIDYGKENIGIDSINLDIIYGLPYQSEKGLNDTLNKLYELRPGRIALYSYAHFPSLFRHHKVTPLEVIPIGNEKLKLFLFAREKLLEYGYTQIGFDHFALPEDELAKSYEDHSLRRNFMGYTTKAGTDLLAFGYSSISEFSTSYAQNTKNLEEYTNMIEKYGTAVVKGTRLSEDDILRKEVIMNILCQGNLDLSSLELKFGKSVDKIANIANQSLKEYENIGFVKKNAEGWELSPTGNIFGRIIASNFDAHYDSSKQLYSRSV